MTWLRRRIAFAMATLFATASCAMAQEDGEHKNDLFKPIEPIVSKSEEFGSSMSTPMVDINDYTGTVSGRFGSFGVDRLSIDLFYTQNVSNIEEVTQKIPFTNTGRRDFMWGLGYLAVDPYRLSVNYSDNPAAATGNNLQVVLVENGSPVVFARDTVFQTKHPHKNAPLHGDLIPYTICDMANTDHAQAINLLYSGQSTILPCEDTHPRMDNHFLDAGGRRLQRLVHAQGNGRRLPLFGKETYQMVDQSGAITTYHPAGDNPNFAERKTAYYYPVSIEYPDGGSISIQYDGAGEFGLSSPASGPHNTYRGQFKPVQLEDNFGRTLYLHYSSDDYPLAITLQESGYKLEPEVCRSRDDICSIAIIFEYPTETRMLMKTAEGYTSELEFQKLPLNDNGYFPGYLLTKAITPNGGLVDINYDIVNIPKIVRIYVGNVGGSGEYCPPTTTVFCSVLVEDYYKYWRVTSVNFDGMTYQYQYGLPGEDDKPILEDHTGFSDLGRFYKVAVKGLVSNEEIYSRTSYFIHEDTNIPQLDENHLKHLVGQKYLVLEKYKNKLNQVSERVEHSEHVTHIYSNSEAVLGIHQGNDITRRSTRLGKHRVKKDDRWLVTEFNYHSIDFGGGYYNLFSNGSPTNIKQYYEGEEDIFLEQSITYDDIYIREIGEAGIEFDRVYDHPWRVGALASIDVVNSEAGLSKNISRYSKTYDDTSSRVKAERFYTSPLHYYEREYKYDEFGENGLRLSETLLGNESSNKQWIEKIRKYTFGYPSLIDSPDSGVPSGNEIARTYDFKGLMTKELNRGITYEYQHDNDGRPTLISNVNTLNVDVPSAPTVYDYSDPNNTSSPNNIDLPSMDNLRGWSTVSRTSTSGESVSANLIDAWGREIGNAKVVTDSVIPYSKTTFLPIGVVRREQGELGSWVETDVDIWGRPTRKTTFKSNGVRAAYQDYFYRSLENGKSETIINQFTLESLNSGDATTSVSHNVSDFFGRTLLSGSERNNTYSGSGNLVLNAYTRMSYDYAQQNSIRVTTIPDCSSSINCIDDVKRSRVQIFNWRNQLTDEYHPEFDPIDVSVSEGCSLNQSINPGWLKYFYNSKGLLSTVYDRIGVTQYFYFPSDQQRSLMRTECGQTKTLQTLAYNDKHLLEAVDNGDDSDTALIKSIYTYDGLNRTKSVKTLISPPSLGPSNLVLNESSDQLAFSWEGDAQTYIIEIQRSDLLPVVFETSNTQLLVTEEQFIAQALRTAKTDAEQYISDAQSNAEGIIDPAYQYSWKVTGISESFEPTLPSDAAYFGSVSGISLEPNEFNWVLVSGESYTQTGTIKYDPNVVFGDSVKLTIKDSVSPFSLRFASGGDEVVLEPGDQVDFEVTFVAPSELGEYIVDSMGFEINEGEEERRLNLFAVSTEPGLPIPMVEGSLNFGTVEIGESVSKTIQLRNSGDGELDVTIYASSYDSPVNPSVLSVTPSELYGMTSGENPREITVSFTAAEDMPDQLSLRIIPEQAGVSSLSVPIEFDLIPNQNSGTMSVVDQEIDFGLVFLNRTVEATIRVLNSEPNSILHNFNAHLISHPDGSGLSHFRLLPESMENCGDLEFAERCDVKIEFSAPNYSDEFKVIAVFTHGDNTPVEVEVRAKSVAEANLELRHLNGSVPSRIEFGHVQSISQPAIVPLTANNTGDFHVAYRVESFSGGINEQNPFRPISSSWALLPPGEGHTLNLSFHPDGILPGTYTGGYKIYECKATPDGSVNDCLDSDFTLLSAHGLLNLGSTITWSEDQTTVFPSGAPGQKVKLPLKVINENNSDVPLVLYGKGDFEGRISVAGGAGCSSPYCLPREGSLEQDKLYFDVPSIGPFQGEVCLAIQTFENPINEECIAMSASGVDLVRIQTQYYLNPEEGISVYPLPNMESASNMETWGTCTPVKLNVAVPSFENIQVSVEAPFYISAFTRDVWEEHQEIPLMRSFSFHNREFHVCAAPDATVGSQTKLRFDVDLPQSSSYPDDIVLQSNEVFVVTESAYQRNITAPNDMHLGIVSLGDTRSKTFEVLNSGSTPVNLGFGEHNIAGSEIYSDSRFMLGVFEISALINDSLVSVNEINLAANGQPGDRITLHVRFSPTKASDILNRKLNLFDRDSGRVVHSIGLVGAIETNEAVGDPNASFWNASERGPISSIELGELEMGEFREYDLEIRNAGQNAYFSARFIPERLVPARVIAEPVFVAAGGSDIMRISIQAGNAGLLNGSLEISANGQVVEQLPVNALLGAGRPFNVSLPVKKDYQVFADNGLVGGERIVEIIPLIGGSVFEGKPRFEHVSNSVHPKSAISVSDNTRSVSKRGLNVERLAFSYGVDVANSNRHAHDLIVRDRSTGKMYNLAKVIYDVQYRSVLPFTIRGLENGWIDFRYTDFYTNETHQDMNYQPQWGIALSNHSSSDRNYTVQFQSVTDHGGYPANVVDNGAFTIDSETFLLSSGETRHFTVTNIPQTHGNTLSLMIIRDDLGYQKVIPLRSFPAANSACIDPDSPMYPISNCQNDWPYNH